MTGLRFQMTTGCLLGVLAIIGCGGGGAGAPGMGSGGSSDAAGGSGGVAMGSGGAGSGGNGAGTGGAVMPGGDASMTPDVNGMNDAADVGPLVPAPGEYGTAPTMLMPDSEMAVAAVDDRVYVLGGVAPGGVLRTLMIFDTIKGEWSQGAPLPTPVHHPVAIGVNGKLYSLGGQKDMSGNPDLNLVFSYDPAADAWTPLANMPTARGGGAAAAIGDKIYVVGGRPPAANAFESFDISDNAWTMLPKLPVAFNNRNHLAAAGIGGKIYVAGGRYNGPMFNAPRTDALDMFDPETSTWTAKKPMLRPRGGSSGVAAFGCFHVYGGEGADIGEPGNVYPDHDVYNPLTDTWTAAKRLARPFHGAPGGAFINGLIYMPGGGTSAGGGSSAMHQTYRPDQRCP